MTKPTVYLNNFLRKSGFRLQFLRQSAFSVSPLLERSDVLRLLKFDLGRVENIVEKGENAGYQHFLLFPECFLKAGFLLRVVKSRDCVVKSPE